MTASRRAEAIGVGPVASAVAYLGPRLAKITRDPSMVYRFVRHHARHYLHDRRYRRLFARAAADLRVALETTLPVPVAASGDAAVHTLCGARGVVDALFCLKTLYRFVPERYPLVIHEDGSFSDGDVRLVSRHFPGARVIRRAEADRAILAELDARGLERCADFRRTSVFALKIFDLQHYAEGRRVCYVDADVLFHRRPAALLAALAAPDGEFADRYNVDVRSCFTWPADSVLREFGVLPPARPVNSGLMVVRRDPPAWDVYERCLELAERDFWVEQSLWAVDFARNGAQPLPADYDVCFRDAWPGISESGRDDALRRRWHGRAVVSEHYCGGLDYRALFYDRALALHASEMAPGARP